MQDPAKSPLLSVTVLNYNYGHYVTKCLDSILAQDFKDFEVIVIDDKSTDDSLAVIDRYLTDPRVRLIAHAVNQGFVKSLNEGAVESRGKYITVISADDWVHSPTAFSQQVQMMEKHGDMAFVYCAYGHYSDDNTLDHVRRAADSTMVKAAGDEAFCHVVRSPFFLHSGTIIRRSAYDAVGGYDATYRYSVDTKMWLMLSHQGSVGYINDMLYGYRRHPTNMSKFVNSFKIAIDEILRAIDAAFSALPSHKQIEFGSLRREVEQRALVAFAVDDIFRDWYAVGWRAWLESFKIRPLDTLAQKMTFVLIARTALGPKGYAVLRRILTRKPTLPDAEQARP